MSSIAWTVTFEIGGAKKQPSISANASVAAKWIGLENDLKLIRRYKDNWDGFGTSAAHPKIVDTAIAFLYRLKLQDSEQPPFKVALSPNGSICIEWQVKGRYLEAEIASEGEVEWMSVIHGETPEHWIQPLTATGNNAWPNAPQIAPVAAASV